MNWSIPTAPAVDIDMGWACAILAMVGLLALMGYDWRRRR